jgi:CheY-like chemotaxis protein/HPt (histidine-containing phosphotransfer) domain-containing protein/HAMP domain-containing protein
MPTTGWVVRAQMPVAEAFESLRERLVTAGVIAAVTSFLAVALGVRFARRITAPLDRLVEAVERVGTESAAEPRPVTSLREVARLSAAFESMQQRLAERTAQHEAAEEVLRRQATSLHAPARLNQSLVSSLALEDVLHELTRSAEAAPDPPIVGGATSLPSISPPREIGPILVVEDSPMNRLTVLAMLEHLGYRGHAVENGLLGLEALVGGAYAAILMDCQMPVLDGYEATAQIRQREAGRTHVPIIAMTASAMLSDRDRCLAAGMDDYIAKPLEPAALASALERWTRPGASTAPADEQPKPADPLVSVLDLAHLDGLLRIKTSDGATLVNRMVGYFVESAPAHANRLWEAAAIGDLATVAQVAYRLTGESASVGAKEVGRRAREIDVLAQGGTSPLEGAHLAPLEQSVVAAIAALRELRETASASPAA